MTRRQVLAGATAAGLARGAGLNVGEVMERIKKQVGVPWQANTVDTIKAGSPETPVKGIATTMMATFDVMKRASSAGLNFVITHEPTFYNHEDQSKDFSADPTWQAKDEFIRKIGMAIMRFHDHWHSMRPDGIATGMAEELGWKPVGPGGRRFQFDNVRLADLASEMKKKLGAKTVRVVGDPELRVKSAAANWGYANLQGGMRGLAGEADVLIIGEAREWEVVEYAADTVTAGRKKGLIVLGHIASEQAGMKYCARWLKSFISEVPVQFVVAEEPFWPA
jgi:putative NIF3 family GTP cyclohydrolase 1 type 2